MHIKCIIFYLILYLKTGRLSWSFLLIFLSQEMHYISEHYRSNILAKKIFFHANQPVGNKTDEV